MGDDKKSSMSVASVNTQETLLGVVGITHVVALFQKQQSQRRRPLKKLVDVSRDTGVPIGCCDINYTTCYDSIGLHHGAGLFVWVERPPVINSTHPVKIYQQKTNLTAVPVGDKQLVAITYHASCPKIAKHPDQGYAFTLVINKYTQIKVWYYQRDDDTIAKQTIAVTNLAGVFSSNIAFFPNGDYIVAWLEFAKLNTKKQAQYTVYARCISHNGHASDIIPISNRTYAVSSAPRLITTSTGSSVLSWLTLGDAPFQQ